MNKQPPQTKTGTIPTILSTFRFVPKKKESAPGARGWWVPNFRKPNDEPFWDIKVQYREEERKKINYQK